MLASIYTYHFLLPQWGDVPDPSVVELPSPASWIPYLLVSPSLFPVSSNLSLFISPFLVYQYPQNLPH